MESNQDQLTAWMNSAGKVPVLPKDQVIQITRRIQSLDESSPERKKLVGKIALHNMRLVVRFVHNFMRSKSMHKWGSTETLDYLQVGVFGLIRAAEKYDPERGYTFSTYANHWIRSFVGRYNMKASSPFNISEEACRCLYSFERHGRLPAGTKVGTGWKETPEKMCEIVRAAQSPVSLYSELENGGYLIDHLEIAKESPVDFHEGQFSPEFEDTIKNAGLTREEDSIIRAVFLDNMKRPEVCKMQGISEGQFSKRKSRALQKIKESIASASMGM